MKFYESHYEDYLQSAYKAKRPAPENLLNIPKTRNMIIYGPSGVGKYTRSLEIIRKHSPSNLKYDKRITVSTEKTDYTYHISDVHFEIDMSLLGCNAKLVWKELFSQITDIIAVRTEKFGIILCRNFHTIHSELLETFYSYMQRHNNAHIRIQYILLTEHLSFLPNNILNSCDKVSVGRPTKENYKQISGTNSAVLNSVNPSDIINGKEVKSFKYIKTGDELPKDIFNLICDNIIDEIRNHNKLSMSGFRETIYDILTYNLDVAECMWYILYHLIHNADLSETDISDMLERTHQFLKYYNNNYRPIYHIESILFYFIIKVHRYEPTAGMPSSTYKSRATDARTSSETISDNGTEVPSR